MNPIVRPVITEKSIMDAHNGKYAFVVKRGTKKEAIKKAVEKIFNVHVVSLKTTVVKGKTARFGAKRTEKKFSPVKKAVVIVKEGEKIGIFEA